jgi:hypothetical protein
LFAAARRYGLGMRVLVGLSVAMSFGACTSTAFVEPRILVSPYLALHQLRGDVAMQSAPGGILQGNAAQPLRTFGQDHHREDVGVRADIGDGFAGARIDYYHLEMNAPRGGVLDADWGNLVAGDTVRMRAEMDELRIGYVESLLTTRTTWREQPLTLRLAVGAVFAHRSLDLRARTEDGARTQNVGIEGDNVYGAVRMRASWRDWSFDAEYAASPELVVRGDFEDLLQDLELRIGYTMPLHDVTFFGGYRMSTLDAEGGASGFEYDADLTLDGFQLGLSVTF